MTNRILLALLGTMAAAPAAAQPRGAPARPAVSVLSAPQKLAQADEHLDRMKQVLKQVIGRLEEARSEKDSVRLNCVNEKLTQEGRQAGVVVFREAHPGYILPVGVWNVRENVREALRHEPSKFETLQGALGHIMRRMDIPLRRWIRTSGVLKDRLYQRRLEDFMGGGGCS